MIFLAFRYLLRRRRQTLFTFLGVFFGTVAYVAVSGFFLGFQGYLVEQLVDNTAQIHIQAREDTLSDHQLDSAFFQSSFGHVFWASPPAGMESYLAVQNPQSWYARLDADPRVEAYSPLMTVPALFTSAQISVSANFIGCNPEQQERVTTVAKYVTDGRFADVGHGGNRVILGDELMKRLGTAPQKTILISVGTLAPAPFKVIGRFYTGNRSADLQAYGALADVQKLKGAPNQVNEIAVRLHDYKQSSSIATNWSSLAPEKTESWDQLFVNVLSMFRLQTTLRFAMILTVLIVAGFGIYNILNMTVNQKRQDIAILRSMGYDTFDIITLFFSQGLLIGICGAAIGLLVGYLLCLYLQTISFMPGTAASGTTGYLHISLSPMIYLEATAMALLTSCIASILPARAAGKLTPIDVIRQGG